MGEQVRTWQIKNADRKRSNNMALLLLPALIFIFFMGWSTYWIGEPEKTEAGKTNSTEKRQRNTFACCFGRNSNK